MRFLEEFHIPWHRALKHHLDTFCSTMRATPAPSTGEPYSTNTINRRRIAIILFYEWARVEFGSFGGGVRRDCLMHKECHPKRKLEKLSTEKSHVSVIFPHQARPLVKALGKRPSELAALYSSVPAFERKAPIVHLESSRDRLAVEIALKTGLRLFEVTGLTLSNFNPFKKQTILQTELYQVGNILRKGGRKRSVDFPGALITEILTYIDGERSCICRWTGSKTDRLILNPMRSGFARGKPVSRRTIERRFSSACMESGLTKIIQRVRIEESGGVSTPDDVKVPLFVFHDLRHTYTVWTYFARRKSDKAPWVYLQKQLDHAHLSTTTNIYLDSLPQFEQIASDKYMATLHGKT
ncbi:integrase/recombinase XerC [Variovorax sp. YR216]|nr:integrase/recombinase XerC [Variovorax sp. YR216]